ncbi:MAG: methylated-DNA--[protein]-cysteine S-methyltransferase [Aromatoleum sp.]|jgi:AraC family transcriptional regulator of adaptative response/methylated-DNA-[protein]-cysteine methyltransferase|uniref:methylated-DNA--[protein]-cysteine S-methyltransferase n=1 Tax=Aromatoleum sp. TaxID=2307007 RepID=UPI0028958879|nr:methylated-DNA--[protein]-cysteine S-methyltransferase [Aromatoleum sp.]MDT3670982.1 methylated-DNA--[protein]-cysteine S-methyltransferase [Aromatoleum sp.]
MSTATKSERLSTTSAGRPRAGRPHRFEKSATTRKIDKTGGSFDGRFGEDVSRPDDMLPTHRRTVAATDTQIRFGSGESSLGTVLVAQSEHGIRAILIGDDPDALPRDLRDRFPRAQLIHGGAGFDRIVARVVAFVEASQSGLDLPLDPQGTAFQQRVWEALRNIPVGQTASYSEIARRIGAPKAIRAVGSACAANAIAVAIPCHRAVRSDGSLSGYRWGTERKRALLDREAKR